MSSKLDSKVKVFFLRRRRDPLTLSDFDRAKGEGLNEVKEIEIFNSGLLTIDEKDDLNRKLKSDARYQIQRFSQDSHYFFRLIVSAAVFLLIYLFMSLVIRDPLPMIDELLFSSAGAIICWVFLSKMSAQSSLAEKYKLELYKMIEEAKEEDVSFINVFEEYIFDLESEFDILTVADILAKVEEDVLPKLMIKDEDKTPDFFHFIELLKYYANKKDSGIRTYTKAIMENNKADETLSARIVRSSSADGLDVYFLALYVELMQF